MNEFKKDYERYTSNTFPIYIYDELTLPEEYKDTLKNVCKLLHNTLPKLKIELYIHNINYRADRYGRFLKASNFLGITHHEPDKTDNITFYIEPKVFAENKNYQSYVDTFKWTALHEVRHIMQYNDPILSNCIYNKSLDMFINYLCGGKKCRNKNFNAMLHTFHDFMPFEVDANIFASTCVGLLPVSKFNLDSDSLRWFKTQVNKTKKISLSKVGLKAKSKAKSKAKV